jgi:hypothetical protein
VGQSSYATSFEPNYDYPAFGSYGTLLDMKNPQITSSYTTYGASENNEFGSTNYINYPSTTSVQTVVHPEHKSPVFSQYSSVTSHESLSPAHFNHGFNNHGFNGHGINSHALNSHGFNSHQGSNGHSILPAHLSHALNSHAASSNEGVPISQHIEVTRPVVVPVYKKFPYAVRKNIPVAIPHPVLVPFPQPYPVNVMISEPVAVPVIHELRIPVEKEVMYPVHKNIPVSVV